MSDICQNCYHPKDDHEPGYDCRHADGTSCWQSGCCNGDDGGNDCDCTAFVEEAPPLPEQPKTPPNEATRGEAIELYQMITMDGMLRQNDPVTTLAKALAQTEKRGKADGLREGWEEAKSKLLVDLQSGGSEDQCGCGLGGVHLSYCLWDIMDRLASDLRSVPNPHLDA